MHERLGDEPENHSLVRIHVDRRFTISVNRLAVWSGVGISTLAGSLFNYPCVAGVCHTPWVMRSSASRGPQLPGS
jgi:hypothetical protein